MAEQPSLSFGELLRQLRAEARLTQEALAEAARLSSRSVSDWERGINRTAHEDTALLLADALGLSGPRREMFMAVARGKPLPALPSNLPAELTTFIGRGREITEVRALVGSSRLVTLTGAGGAGKTRLALQVAAGLLDRSGDGVWLVELAAVTDQDAVPVAIAGGLRILPQPGRPVLDTLADALGPQDVLIVLDNCEHLLGGCAKTVETILQRCPKVHLIATSREPLGITGERLYRVPSLSLPQAGEDHDAAAISCDAVALLEDRARAQGVSLDLTAGAIELAVSVCRRLDGMPLAIELAAARLRSMSLGELSDRLDQRFRLLTGGSRAALPRQQTLRATIGWSYSLLISAEQLLLARLSVFTGGFDLAAAEAVCGYGSIDAAEVAVLLGSLVDKNLVAAEPAGDSVRYGLLETIRLFAAGRLADAGGQETTAASAAHSGHYLAVAEAAAPHLTGPNPRTWLARLETERSNMMRAAEHASLEPDGTAQVLRFGIALRRYWSIKYGGEEAIALLLTVLRRPDAAADPALLAEALLAAASTAWETADLTTSVKLSEQGDQLASELDDNRLLAMSRGMLAWVSIRLSDYERGRLLGQESVQRAREVGDDVLLADSLKVYAGTINSPGAMQVYAEAIACYERAGDAIDYYAVHVNAGSDALWYGDIPAARAHLETAIRAAEMSGLPPTYAQVNLGNVLREEHDLDGARRAFEEGLRLCRRAGYKLPMAGAILGLGCLAADTGEWHRAATLHGAAQALIDHTGNLWEGTEYRLRAESLDRIAAAIGDEQLSQAYAQGTALSVGRAIELALGKPSPS